MRECSTTEYLLRLNDFSILNNVRISDESYFDFSIFWWCDKCAQIIDSDDGTVIC